MVLRKTACLASAGLLTLAICPTPLQSVQQGRPTAARPAADDHRPRFDRPVRLEETGATSANISLGDLNGDGHVDAVLVKGRHWPLPERVLIGDGTGGFAPARDLGPASDRSYSGVLVDLDGKTDIIVGHIEAPSRVYFNDGSRRGWKPTPFGDSEGTAYGFSIADVDEDGWPDIAVARSDAPNMLYLASAPRRSMRQ